MKRTLKLRLGLGWLVLATAACLTASPIFTSSFSEEVHPFPPGWGFADLTAGQTIGPWTVGAPLGEPGAGVGHIYWYWRAQDADQRSIDMSGSNPGSLMLSLADIDGYEADRWYRLSFYVSHNPDALSSDCLICAPFGTVSRMRIQTSGQTTDLEVDAADILGSGFAATRQDMHWQLYSLIFHGTADDVLLLASLDLTGDQWGVAVDNLSIEMLPIPEPATFALFGAGLAGLALLRRKR